MKTLIAMLVLTGYLWTNAAVAQEVETNLRCAPVVEALSEFIER